MEKKLTDEEIVKALECCVKNDCEKCPYTIKGFDCVISKQAGNDFIDLIHRLQEDYSKLKERYIKVLDLNEKVIAEQKAEIERLKDENIEERDIHFKNLCGYKDEIARLQKQVEELKSENTELYKEHTTLIAGSILEKQQAVKDTAKEILLWLIEHTFESCIVETYFRERFGVEVE